MKMLKLVAAGHQPAADHILERFEIFRSMVSGLLKQVLSCRACNPPFCLALM